MRPYRRQLTRLPVPGILQARTLEWVAISFSNAWKWKGKVKSLSRVRLLATPWTAAYQAPPSMGLSWQEYWSGVPVPSPRTRWYKLNFSSYVWRNSIYPFWPVEGDIRSLQRQVLFLFIYIFYLVTRRYYTITALHFKAKNFLDFSHFLYHVVIRESQRESPFNLTKIYQQNLLQNTFKKECSKIIYLSLVLPNYDCNILKYYLYYFHLKILEIWIFCLSLHYLY